MWNNTPKQWHWVERRTEKQTLYYAAFEYMRFRYVSSNVIFQKGQIWLYFICILFLFFFFRAYCVLLSVNIESRLLTGAGISWEDAQMYRKNVASFKEIKTQLHLIFNHFYTLASKCCNWSWHWISLIQMRVTDEKKCSLWKLTDGKPAVQMFIDHPCSTLKKILCEWFSTCSTHKTLFLSSFS